MRIVVLGATGGTGVEIVRQASEAGHDVTAFVRSPEKLDGFRCRISVKQGNLLNRIDLADAIKDHDAILSAFGPRVPVSEADRNLLHQFAVELTTAMATAKVRRVILESSAFLFRDAILPPAYMLGRLLFPGVVADATAMEAVIQGSGCDWTIVRPPRLTHGSHTRKYRVRESHLPMFGFSISRANVADCLLRLLADPASIRKIVGVSR